MKELITEVLQLHNTLHTDRSESETLRLDRDRLAQSQESLARRCQQLESEATRVQQMLATRNAALKEELGLQTAYSQCLADLSGNCYSNCKPAVSFDGVVRSILSCSCP